MVGYRVGGVVGDVGDPDPVGGGGRDIDVVDAHAVADDKGARARPLEHAPRNGRVLHQDDRGLGQERLVEDLLFVLVFPHAHAGDGQPPARGFDYVPLETVVMKGGVEEEGQVPRFRRHGP